MTNDNIQRIDNLEGYVSETALKCVREHAEKLEDEIKLLEYVKASEIDALKRLRQKIN